MTEEVFTKINDTLTKKHSVNDFLNWFESQDSILAQLAQTSEDERKVIKTWLQSPAGKKFDDEARTLIPYLKHLYGPCWYIQITHKNEPYDATLTNMETGHIEKIEITQAVNGHKESLKQEKLEAIGGVIDAVCKIRSFSPGDSILIRQSIPFYSAR